MSDLSRVISKTSYHKLNRIREYALNIRKILRNKNFISYYNSFILKFFPDLNLNSDIPQECLFNLDNILRLTSVSIYNHDRSPYRLAFEYFYENQYKLNKNQWSHFQAQIVIFIGDQVPSVNHYYLAGLSKKINRKFLLDPDSLNFLYLYYDFLFEKIGHYKDINLTLIEVFDINPSIPMNVNLLFNFFGKHLLEIDYSNKNYKYNKLTKKLIYYINSKFNTKIESRNDDLSFNFLTLFSIGILIFSKKDLLKNQI